MPFSRSPVSSVSYVKGSWVGSLLLGLALALVLLLGHCATGQCYELKLGSTPPVKVPFNSPAAALEEAFTHVAKAVSPAVVNISIEWTERIQTLVPNFGNMQDFFNGFNVPQFGLVPRELERKQQALGSGFIITPDGFILTNAHVVGKAEKITVLLETGRTYSVQVVGRDEKTDIALLKIDAGNSLPCVSMGDSDAIEMGQWAIAIGNPFGLDHTLTSGVISAKSRSIPLNENNPYASYIQTDASINPGNSGGPLCNLQGEVIGINTAILPSQSGTNIGIGFAIPINVARKVAVDLASKGRVTRAGLGINIQPLDSKMAKSFGLQDTQGVLISNVGTDSAAEKAGIKAGDVILALDGEPISGPADLNAKLYQKMPGDHISLGLMRDKQKINSDAILQMIEEPAPVSEQAQAPGPTPDPKAETEKAKLNLGLTFQDMTPELKTQLGTSAPQGPVILQIKQGGAAEAAGLRVGDVVLQAGDHKITDAETLHQVLRNTNLKKGIRLFVWREGATMYCILQKS